MSSYFLILFLVLIFPLIGSLIRWHYQWKGSEWGGLLKAYVFGSIPFVILDGLSHRLGWWSYNPEHIVGLSLIGLPIEEVLFFFVIPFSSLYLYTVIEKITKQRAQGRLIYGLPILLVVFLVGIYLLINQPLQRTVFDVILAYVVTFAWVYNRPNFNQVIWVFAITLLFVITNYFLTSLPIVTYDATYGSSIRFLTIPLEDFLYNLSLLLLALTAFDRNR